MLNLNASVGLDYDFKEKEALSVQEECVHNTTEI